MRRPDATDTFLRDLADSQRASSGKINSHIAFRGDQLVAEGSLSALAQWLYGWSADQRRSVRLFETESGRELELDLRGSAAELAVRYPEPGPDPADIENNGQLVVPDITRSEPLPAQSVKRKRGRPKLGVVGREVTLLPRHWEWLETQRGGGSATLRRLIDQARKELADEGVVRAAQERTALLLTTLARNRPAFEAAIRALYARDQQGFEQQLEVCSTDLQRIAKQFASDAW